MVNLYYVKIRRTFGGYDKEFVASFDGIKDEAKSEFIAFLEKEDWCIGDFEITTENCEIWNPDKSLDEIVSVVLIELWEISGTCFTWICRNEDEIKEAIADTLENAQYTKCEIRIRKDLEIVSINPSKRKITEE